MAVGRRWAVEDRYGNTIYLTNERWEHIIDPWNHPEIANNYILTAYQKEILTI